MIILLEHELEEIKKFSSSPGFSLSVSVLYGSAFKALERFHLARKFPIFFSVRARNSRMPERGRVRKSKAHKKICMKNLEAFRSSLVYIENVFTSPLLLLSLLLSPGLVIKIEPSSKGEPENERNDLHFAQVSAASPCWNMRNRRRELNRSRHDTSDDNLFRQWLGSGSMKAHDAHVRHNIM